MNTRDKALAKAQELGVEVNQEYARFGIEIVAPKGKTFENKTDRFVAEYNPEAGEVRRMAWRKVLGQLTNLENGGKN
jgi:hypothetical protein